MLVLAVGTASAGFVAGEGDARYDRAQEAAGSSAGGGSGGTTDAVQAVLDEIARQPDSALSYR